MAIGAGGGGMRAATLQQCFDLEIVLFRCRRPEQANAVVVQPTIRPRLAASVFLVQANEIEIAAQPLGQSRQFTEHAPEFDGVTALIPHGAVGQQVVEVCGAARHRLQVEHLQA